MGKASIGRVGKFSTENYYNDFVEIVSAINLKR